MRDFASIHPGEQLREEFMKPRGITCERLAENIGVLPWMVEAIVAERHPVTSEMALRLARHFGTSARFWLDLQRDHDLQQATSELGDRLDQEVKVGDENRDFATPERRARLRLG